MNRNLLFLLSTFLLAGSIAQAQTATTTSLTASPSPATFGAAVTLTATVSSISVSGAVTFYDGPVVLGIAPVSSGIAHLVTNALPAGLQKLTARYDGNVSYGASTSGVFSETVKPVLSGSLVPLANLIAGSNPTSVVYGDFNGDGKADIAVANQFSASVNIYLGNGAGAFTSEPSLSAVSPVAMVVGDFNGDGKQDLAVVQENTSSVAVFLGNGNGTFAAGVSYSVDLEPVSITAADFNGDGIIDLATANSGANSVSILLGNSNGTFQTSFAATGSTTIDGTLVQVTAGDFNQDGKMDLAVVVADLANVTILLGTGSGSFTVGSSFGVGADPLGIAVGDFNGDGKLDLAVTNTGGGMNPGPSSVSILVGQGNGSFTVDPPDQNPLFNQPTPVVVGDFNGDGFQDIAVGNYGNNTVAIIPGKGDGTFYPGVAFGAGLNPAGLAVADFNGDGKVDLAVADHNATTGSANVNILSGGPVVLSVAAGSVQTALPGAAYATPLEAQVTAFSANVSGLPVLFTAPSSGASGTFASSGLTATVNTASTGIATAPTFTDNGISGAFQVTAAADGGSTVFSLANTAAGCTYSVSTPSVAFDSTGLPAIPVTVSASSPSCAFVTSTDSPWITVTPFGGGQSGTVTISAQTNTTGLDRVGNIFIGGVTISLLQDFTVQVFPDVPPSSYYFDAVNLMSQHSITAGCSGGDFCPDTIVTRDQMAIFIVRMIFNGDNFPPAPSTPYFADVTPQSSFAFPWIQKLAQLGISGGCGGNDYCPTVQVTRDQMAIFIIRARYGATTNFTAAPIQYFTDVPPNYYAYPWIERMAEDGITGGCGANIYCPTSPVTRGSMAIFVMRGGFNQLLVAGEPIITSISPNTITHGAAGSTYTVTGASTNFGPGTTVVSLGGITASNVVVTSPTTLTVTLTASSGAALQPEAVYVQGANGSTEAVLPNGITVQ